MRNKYPHNQGSSIVVIILMIGFLLILTTGVYNLVLREMKDSRGAGSYLKAYAGAEGAMELGLLGIKENGYGFDKDLDGSYSGSEVLSFNTTFKKGYDPKISYNMNIKTNSYSGTIATGATLLIPLFWKTETGSGNLTNFTFNIVGGQEDNIIWNIIGNGEGMSGTGGFLETDIIRYRNTTGGFTNNNTISQFLGDNKHSYLMLFNKNNTSMSSIILEANSGQFFSNPVGKIVSSVTVGMYKQNISTTIDNTAFLNMLKYSLFSK